MTASANTTRSFVAALPNLVAIKLSGEQRHEYLHGQITVATKIFDEQQAKIAAHCDFKGKMFSAMYVSDYEDAFLLSTQKDAAEVSIAQLKKYGVFSKVTIEAVTHLHAYGVFGKVNIASLTLLFPQITDKHLCVSANDFGQAICFNDHTLRYLCWLTESGKQRLMDSLEDDAMQAEDAWEQLEIDAGIANIQASTIGEFVPQMLNFQAIDGIDFKKGCYMGQEVVARTKFLGKNKRAAFILRGTQSTLPVEAKAGANIEIQLGDNWRRAGVINRIVQCDNKISALAVMSNDTALGTVVRLKDTDILLAVEPLPYSIID